jgi:2-oxoisovalerate dehydrogenase E1 component
MIFNQYKKEIKEAILIRQFETQLLHLFSEGKINGTVHTCVGEELTPVLLCRHLTGSDYFLSNHRGHGHFIAKTGKVYELMAEMMGRVTGISHGYGGSQHLFTDGFISNGIQGGMTPLAVGIGLAMKINNSKDIAVSFLGDGTLGEGIIYESFNLCSIWELPVLYILENNHYAQSTSAKQTFTGDIRKRVEGFGLKYFRTDVWDITSLDSVFEEAVKIVRQGCPAFVEVDCYRLNSHSKSDDNRNEEEIQFYREKDLLNRFSEQFPDIYNEYLQEANTLLDTIVLQAENDPILHEVENKTFITSTSVGYERIEGYEKRRGNESIYTFFKKLFKRNHKTVLIGEDVEHETHYTPVPYGGAFKVTRDLSQLFPGRVRNTPISEASITGAGIGLSLMGYTSIVEIMFGDFMTLTFDQLLQHASKISSMYGRKVSLPFVLRTPMGGRRGYGPTHSQSIEKHFLGILDLNIVAINNAIPAEELYEGVFRDLNTPTVVIENKVQYTRTGFKRAKGFYLRKTDENLPTILYGPGTDSVDLTIVCYGGMLEIVKSVIERLALEDIICEIVCPSSLVPINIYPIIESIRVSKRILMVEEGNEFAALGSEILAYILANNIEIKAAQKIGNNTVIPCSFSAENSLLPNEEKITNTIKSLL